MIYDITQPVFGCAVYPGDPVPERKIECSMDKGDLYNLTYFSMCAHNGTHVDAPAHFIKDGKTIEQLPLDRFTGPAFVAELSGQLGAADAKMLLEKACGVKKLLIKGDAVVTAEAAKVFADADIELLGNESQSVGPLEAPMEVHKLLLGKELVLLEGIRLGAVPEGSYFLCCAPLLLNGAEGAPCRAVLWDL